MEEQGNEEASSSLSDNLPRESNTLQSAASSGPEHDGMKRAAAKKLIERYFYQLIDGCGNPHCDNLYCASSAETRNLTPNEAAAEAIKLFSQEARLCDAQPHKVPRTEASTDLSNDSGASNSQDGMSHAQNHSTPLLETDLTMKDVIQPAIMKTDSKHCDNQQPQTSQSPSHHDSSEPYHNNGATLTEEHIYQLCDECLATKTPQPLVRALGEAFGQPAILSRCFKGAEVSSKENVAGVPSCSDYKEKERLRASEVDPDKDVDSITGPGLDIPSCRRAFEYMKKVPCDYYSSALVTALTSLAENIEIDLRITKKMNVDDVVNCFLIAFEVPNLSSSDYLEVALPALCHAAEYLPVPAQGKLAKTWATHCKESLRNILESLQQLITLRVISKNYTRSFSLQDDDTVTVATKLMRVVFYANILAGSVESNTLREEPIILTNQFDPLGDALDHLNPFITIKHSKQSQQRDELAAELDLNILDARKPYLPFEEFYNEPLSDTIEMDKDFTHYKTELNPGKKFSYLRYPFVLTPATKALGLYLDHRVRMYSERRTSLLHAVVSAAPPAPFLRLRVRRQHIVDDALVELEMVAMERATDLKKQLVVEFEGEQGVDEGGVSKEFFQLIVEEIFNPDFGMFTHQTDTQTVWFNPTSFESEAQFTLIGIVLGLAIYNNIILAVNFPMVVYRKLMGKKGSFEDLADWNPILYSGLKNMLEYPDNDMEEVFIQTFRICYQDVFGSNIFHELKPNGDDIMVNQENKQEFVDLYADFLLNKSMECQFKAFRRGFIMVTDESPLSVLFRPEEVETLVCGSKKFDFNELEKSTEYDGGYTSESQIIKDFWSIVHELPLDDKRKLLQFTTGSDRVPVGGLSRLKLVIARNGPDCDRLPTAHTCFNVLLLPEYENKEKLSDRLLKAINYSKGFGML